MKALRMRSHNLTAQAHHVAWLAADWVFPPVCAICGSPGFRLCPQCRANIKPINHPTACPRCDLPGYAVRPCPDCAKNPLQLDGLRAFAPYEEAIKAAIHSYKFKRNLGLAEQFAEWLYLTIKETQWQFDWITAVPLGQQRSHDRGYNQSAYLARLLAWKCDRPYFSDLSERSRETRSQASLTAEERLTNVSDAFCPGNRSCAGRSVLIIDDIATTGATLNACAAALYQNGAEKVYGLTLARAVHYTQS